MILWHGNWHVVHIKPITGIALGVRYEPNLIGEGSNTIICDLIFFSIFVTW